MLQILMLAYSVLGYFAHLCREPITGHMRRGWEDVTNYAIGVLAVFPLGRFMFHYLREEINDPDTRFAVAYVFSFISFGLGVFIGHWHKPVKEKYGRNQRG